MSETINILNNNEVEKMVVDAAVRERYSAAAQQAESALCCPVNYDPQFLKIIPQEILERDYGCGDPSKWVCEGETVLDLGSGGGKICYIAAQIVKASGKVIGVDCNDDMLSLAKSYQSQIAESLGYDAVSFRKGRIQDLRLDLDLLENYLQKHPIRTSADWLHMQEHADHLRKSQPMIADDSVDVVVSNCVLNLVKEEDRRQLFTELHRVLKRGGRAVISDIVCDEEVPQRLKNDAKLWSGCLSGAFKEDQFLKAFEDAGFYGMEIVERQEEAWAVIEGIEFRSLTVQAFKGKEGPCLDRHQAVIYNGPWKEVLDDDGHRLIRGERMAVCDKTYQIYTNKPYANQITKIDPVTSIPLEQAKEFNCLGTPMRDPKLTKQGRTELTLLPDGDCCGTEGCC